MTMPVPQNSNETAYTAFVLIDGLFSLLAEKGLIGQSDLDGVHKAAASRLKKENNSEANRASDFLTRWINREPEIE